MNTVHSTHPPIKITSEELEEHFEFLVDLCHRENITFMFEHNNKWMYLVPTGMTDFFGSVAESVDAPDLKSVENYLVGVQVPPLLFPK